MDKEEIVKLREHLRRSLGSPLVNVVPSVGGDAADVRLGERKIGALSADDEDGDRSFFFEMAMPVERPALQDYLRKLFENNKLTIVGRAKKTDSVELNNGSDFLGVDHRRRPQWQVVHARDGDPRHRSRRPLSAMLSSPRGLDEASRIADQCPPLG